MWLLVVFFALHVFSAQDLDTPCSEVLNFDVKTTCFWKGRVRLSTSLNHNDVYILIMLVLPGVYDAFWIVPKMKVQVQLVRGKF